MGSERGAAPRAGREGGFRGHVTCAGCAPGGRETRGIMTPRGRASGPLMAQRRLRQRAPPARAAVGAHGGLPSASRGMLTRFATSVHVQRDGYRLRAAWSFCCAPRPRTRWATPRCEWSSGWWASTAGVVSAVVSAARREHAQACSAQYHMHRVVGVQKITRLFKQHSIIVLCVNWHSSTTCTSVV